MNKLKNYIKALVSGQDSRTNKMRKNIAVMFGVKGLSILISLAYVPLVLHAVNRVDYGILLTLTSMVHWVSMLDIGLGCGLRNKISEAIVSGDRMTIRKYISSSYALLAIVVAILIALFMCCSPFISWRGVLNAPENDELQLRLLAIVVFVAFCIQFFLNLLNSILYAYQLPAYNSVFSLAGQAISFIVVYVLINVFDVTDILSIGSITCFIPPLVLAVATLFLFSGRLKDVKPSWRLIQLSSAKNILSLGVRFFILQIITLVLFYMNSFIIAQVVGPAAVVEYNIGYKYISMITMVYTIIVTPVWSASSDAYARNDYDWIYKTIKYLKKVSFLVFIVGVIMVLISKPVYDLWLSKGTIDIPYETTSLLLLYSIAWIMYQNYGYIINGTGRIHAQMVITGIIAIVYLPICFYLGKIWGLTGVLIVNAVVQIINYMWSKIQVRIILKNPYNASKTNFWLK